MLIYKKMDKTKIRHTMRQLNKRIGGEVRERLSQEIFAQVEALEEFRRAHCIGLFCALDDEPSTRDAITRWRNRGARVAVPRVEGDCMQFYLYDPEKMVIGAFGIEEPGSDSELCRPEDLDLVVVPGVAFTPQGDRMGRGRGYYDRYLAQPTLHATKVGVCYSHQIVATLPTCEHDIGMNHIVSNVECKM